MATGAKASKAIYLNMFFINVQQRFVFRIYVERGKTILAFARAVLICSLRSRINGIRRLSTGFYTDATQMSRGFVWHSDRERQMRPQGTISSEVLLIRKIDIMSESFSRLIYMYQVFVEFTKSQTLISFFSPLNIRCRDISSLSVLQHVS